ncbi:MAG: hypothetical protein GAK45_02242 [Pseudomonas citronellolis]|nr:MAG: hypothetical protein GAK45_02242 [Pseudomonas citronellolis]
MTYAHSQRGLSILGWLVVLALIAFAASTAFKIIPHYMDYYAIEKSINSAGTDKAAEVHSVPEFYAYVDKALMLNNIRDLNLQDAMDVQLDNNEFRVHIKYDRREPLVQNIDLLIHFDKELRVRAP